MPEIPIKYLKYIDNTGKVQKAYGITVLKAVYDADGNTLDEILQTYDNKVGDTSSLTTTANTDLVSAINEVDGNVGDLSGLSTTAKNNLVAAVNELNQNLSNISANIQSDNTINILSVDLPYTFEKSGVVYIANNDSTGAILIGGCWLGGFEGNTFMPVTKEMIMYERTGNIGILSYIPNKESYSLK